MTAGEPGAAHPQEIEVKLPCEDLEAIRAKLKHAGAALSAPLHGEVNDLYDDAEGSLAARGCALRLRRAGGDAILTFKGPARFEQGVKVREEREVRVSDAAEVEAILAGVGLRRRFRYEKNREEWNFEGCLVALDETPIGRYVEVEGSPSGIRGVVSLLGLDFAEAIPYSYAKLYTLRRKENPGLPEDMVFAGARGARAQT